MSYSDSFRKTSLYTGKANLFKQIPKTCCFVRKFEEWVLTLKLFFAGREDPIQDQHKRDIVIIFVKYFIRVLWDSQSI